MSDPNSIRFLTERLLSLAPGPPKFLALVADFEARCGRARRAARLSRWAGSGLRRDGGESHLALARDLDAWAETLEALGDSFVGQVGLAARDFVLVRGYRRVAVAHCRRGRPELAEPFLRRALEILRDNERPDHPELAALSLELAESSRAQGRYGEAEETLCRVLDLYHGLLTERHPGLLPTSRQLASLYFETGNWAAAEPVLLRIREIHRHCLGTEHPGFARSQSDLADLFVRLGKRAEARGLYYQAIEIFQFAPASNRRLAPLFLALAHLHRLEGRPGPAEAAFHRAWKAAASALGKHHVTAARIANDLGTFYHEQGRLRAARVLYEHAAEVLRRDPAKRFAVLGACLRNLALGRRQRGDEAHAAELDREYALHEAAAAEGTLSTTRRPLAKATGN